MAWRLERVGKDPSGQCGDVFFRRSHFAGGHVWTRYMVSNANCFKNGIKTLIFSSPIRLHGNDFSSKATFNKSLKLMKNMKNFRSMSDKINPCKFAKIINKADIVIFAIKRIWGRPPYIGKDQF